MNIYRIAENAASVVNEVSAILNFCSIIVACCSTAVYVRELYGVDRAAHVHAPFNGTIARVLPRVWRRELALEGLKK
jgi:hypothetical protein